MRKPQVSKVEQSEVLHYRMISEKGKKPLPLITRTAPQLLSCEVLGLVWQECKGLKDHYPSKSNGIVTMPQYSHNNCCKINCNVFFFTDKTIVLFDMYIRYNFVKG